MQSSATLPSEDEAAESGSQAETGHQDKDQYIAFDLRKLLISAFLIWQIFAVTIWVLPGQGGRLGLGPLVAGYMLSTGEWQQWTMFSPEPARTNFYVEARIEYADGVVRMWKFPRVRDMGLVERYQRERYRKMMEVAYPDVNRRLWPYMTRYIALENDRAGDKHAYPMTIHLIRHVQVLPDFPKPIQPPTNEEIYVHTYDASPAASLGKHQ